MRSASHDPEELARAFRALAAESRVRIVQLLAQRTLCVGALSNLVGISAGAVSQHLRILKDAGLVEADRRGYFIHYRVAPSAAELARGALDALFGTSRAKPRKSTRKTGGERCAAERRNARGRRT